MVRTPDILSIRYLLFFTHKSPLVHSIPVAHIAFALLVVVVGCFLVC